MNIKSAVVYYIAKYEPVATSIPTHWNQCCLELLWQGGVGSVGPCRSRSIYKINIPSVYSHSQTQTATYLHN